MRGNEGENFTDYPKSERVDLEYNDVCPGAVIKLKGAMKMWLVEVCDTQAVWSGHSVQTYSELRENGWLMLLPGRDGRNDKDWVECSKPREVK